MIPFNKPYLSGNEMKYIEEAVKSGKISGDGLFTKKCSEFINKKFGFKSNLLTTSCTDALEMAAILLNISDGDEVIMPSYTFVSTANPFAIRGAHIRFCDSNDKNPNIDVNLIEPLITEKTKAIVVVHYAGISCDMDPILDIAERYGIAVVEDAAQAIDSYYKGKPLGSLGTFGTFSFHETKNIISGEGGLLVINNEKYLNRAEIIREKGTNRSSFFRGEVNKYGWVDIGSSFLPSDMISAFLFAQLENISRIQNRRKLLWERYYTALCVLESQGSIQLPQIPDYATNNAHMFYIVTDSLETRNELITYLKEHDVHAVFHYLSLHKSDYYNEKHDGRVLHHSDRYTDCLIRLPMFYDLEESQVDYISNLVNEFYTAR